MAFHKAERRKAKLRLGITGPAGSGKTYGALLVGMGLGGKIAMIDTENGSGDLYSGLGDYDVCTIVKRSYLSPCCVTVPLQLVEAMLSSRCHIIATMRSKTEYILEENERGKKEPRKVGMVPVQRDGMDYEFGTVFDLGLNHTATVSKDRTSLFDGQVFTLSKETGAALRAWLDSGADAPIQTKGARPPEAQAHEPTLTEKKRNLYNEYLAVCDNQPQHAQNAMMKVTEGRGSKDWTEEDMRHLAIDLARRRGELPSLKADKGESVADE